MGSCLCGGPGSRAVFHVLLVHSRIHPRNHVPAPCLWPHALPSSAVNTQVVWERAHTPDVLVNYLIRCGNLCGIYFWPLCSLRGLKCTLDTGKVWNKIFNRAQKPRVDESGVGLVSSSVNWIKVIITSTVMINRQVLWKESWASILHGTGILMVSLIRWCGPCSCISSLLFPPAVMTHPHQQQVAPSALSQQNHPPQNPPAGLLSMPNALTTQQQQQQKLRLQRIQMERERIRMRQEELMRQVWPSMGPGWRRLHGLWYWGWWVGSC